MKYKVKIKVIKKNAVKIYKMPVVTEKNLKQRAAGEIVSTVSDWISEFQQRRRRETKQALAFLYSTSTNGFPQKS